MNKAGKKFLAAIAITSFLSLAQLAVGRQDEQMSPQQQPQADAPPEPADHYTPPTESQRKTKPTGSPLPREEHPNVKSRSKDDVNAIGNRNVGKGLNFYSLGHEMTLGKELAQEVDRSVKFIDDPIVNEYVNRVGQNLVRNSDARVPFTIKVIDSDTVNAFALPGGFLYVNSGLILRADEEAEMAGAMAHEIAHVCARHGTKHATKRDMAQLAMIPAMVFIPYSWAGYALYQGLNVIVPLTFLKFTRDEEREADFLGLQYIYRTGYDPNAFTSFFEKIEAMEKKYPGTIPKVFSSHPPTPDRVEAAQREIATILSARDEYIVTTSEFESVKRRLQMIESSQRVNNQNPNKPTLRRRTEQNKGGDGTEDQTQPDSDRKLKRRPENILSSPDL